MLEYQLLNKKLESLIDKVKFTAKNNLKLERIKTLLELLDNPQDSLSIIHVGGTSGKGSTATFIASLLQTQGYKTGLFLSPYLQILNETWQINQCPAKTSELLTIFDTIEPLFSQVAARTGFGLPSYFEIKFALAILLFKRHQVDVAVIEVGLGGRLDTTNVVNAMISVLVSVGLDHTEILGDTVELIATDKVEIIKPYSTVICGFTQDSTIAIAQAKATSVKANLLLLNQDFSYYYQNNQLSITTPSHNYQHLSITLQGQFQAHNAACAVLAYEVFLQQNQLEANVNVVRLGLQNAYIAGRMEQVQSNPTVFLDGAHNPDKLNLFFNSLRQLNQRIILILALKMGKELNTDIFALIKQLQAKHIVVTQFEDKAIWQAIPAIKLQQLLIQNDVNPQIITIINKPFAAIEYALSQADVNDVIAITGSLFLVGDCRDFWYPKAQLLAYVENDCKINKL